MPVMPRRKIDITKALFVAERGGFRPPPLAPEARLIRPGRKVQLVEVIARQDGVEVALGRALRIRTADIHLPKAARHVEIPFAPPESGVLMASKGVPRTFHSEGAELRFVEG